MFKGYSSSRKVDGSEVAFPTVEPIRTEQHGISMLAHQFMREVATDAAETGSASGDVKATAHAALKGDVVRVTSGAFSGYESKVVRTDADHIYLADDITLANGVTIQILRHKYPMVDADGGLQTSLSAAAIKYDEDGTDIDVHEDTDTPANSKPLPVKLLNGSNGALVDPASQATLASVLTEIEDLNANDFATAGKQDIAKLVLDDILAQLTANGSIAADIEAAVDGLEATVATEATLASLEGKDFATQTTLAAVLAKIIAAPATEAKQDTQITGLASLLTELQLKADLSETQPVSAASLPLPLGAATEATLAAASGKLPATLGQKTGANSLAVVPASDYTPPAPGGNGYADSVRKASGSVTSAAWVEIIASTAAAAKGLCIFDSTGYSYELAIGAAASEVRKLLVPPGGLNGFIPLAIPAGSRVSIKALNTTLDYTSAELILTLLG